MILMQSGTCWQSVNVLEMMEFHFTSFPEKPKATMKCGRYRSVIFYTELILMQAHSV